MKDGMFHQLCAAAILLLTPLSALAATTEAPRVQSANLEQRARHLSRTLSRGSQFIDVPHTNWRSSCEQVQAPVALATPDPLLTPAGRGKSVRVSFIIGTDGHVD